MLKKKYVFSLAIITSLMAPTALLGEDTVEAKIKRALSAAPDRISAKATVIDMDGTVLKKGANEWTCFPGVPLMPGDDHPMCNDGVWMGWLKAMKAGKTFSTKVIGYSYMLMGDAMVNNADPTATDQNDGGQWIQEGPHLMLLMPSADNMAGLSRDPNSGGPYVMWDNTPMVHVMVPLAAKQN